MSAKTNNQPAEPIASLKEIGACQVGDKFQPMAGLPHNLSSQITKSRSKVQRVSLAAQLLPGPAVSFSRQMDTGCLNVTSTADKSRCVDATTVKEAQEAQIGQFSELSEHLTKRTLNVGQPEKKNVWVPCQQTETSANSTELNSSIAAQKEESSKMQDVGAFNQSRAQQIFGVPSIFSLPCDLDFLGDTCSDDPSNNVYSAEFDTSQNTHEPADQPQTRKGAGKDCKVSQGKSQDDPSTLTAKLNTPICDLDENLVPNMRSRDFKKNKKISVISSLSAALAGPQPSIQNRKRFNSQFDIENELLGCALSKELRAGENQPQLWRKISDDVHRISERSTCHSLSDEKMNEKRDRSPSMTSSVGVEFGVPQNYNEEQILSKFRAIWSKQLIAKELLASPEKRPTRVMLHEQLGLPVPPSNGENKENERVNRQRVNLASQLGKWNGVENVLRQRVTQIAGPTSDKALQSAAVSAFVLRQIVKR